MQSLPQFPQRAFKIMYALVHSHLKPSSLSSSYFLLCGCWPASQVSPLAAGPSTLQVAFLHHLHWLHEILLSFAKISCFHVAVNSHHFKLYHWISDNHQQSEINIGKHIDPMGSKAVFVLVSGMDNCEVIGSLVNVFMLGWLLLP